MSTLSLRLPKSLHAPMVEKLTEAMFKVLPETKEGSLNLQGLPEIVSTIEKMDAALENPDRYIEADLDFHLVLAEATQNSLIPALIDSIVDLLREQRARIFQAGSGPEHGQVHHKLILDAIIRHDPASAREAMRAHLQQVREDSQVSANHSS